MSIDTDDPRALEAIRDEIRDSLLDDFVNIIEMTNCATAVVPTATFAEQRALVVNALPALLDDPDLKIVQGLTGSPLTTREALLRHLDDAWPVDGTLGYDPFVVWLMRADDDFGPGTFLENETPH